VFAAATAGSTPAPAQADPPRADRLVGDPRRIRAATGWAPEVPLTRALERLLAYWRSRVAAGFPGEEEEP